MYTGRKQNERKKLKTKHAIVKWKCWLEIKLNKRRRKKQHCWLRLQIFFFLLFFSTLPRIVTATAITYTLHKTTPSLIMVSLQAEQNQDAYMLHILKLCYNIIIRASWLLIHFHANAKQNITDIDNSHIYMYTWNNLISTALIAYIKDSKKNSYFNKVLQAKHAHTLYSWILLIQYINAVIRISFTWNT